MNVNKYWLKQSNIITWYKKPSFAYKKKVGNYFDWYSDGKINIYENCSARKTSTRI